MLEIKKIKSMQNALFFHKMYQFLNMNEINNFELSKIKFKYYL